MQMNDTENPELEIQQSDIFSAESFLAEFNQDVQKLFDNNQFADYYVNNNNTMSIQYNVKEELINESNETNGNQGSKSEKSYGNVGRGSPKGNVEQFTDRSDSEVGRDSGSRYSRNGHGNNLREHKTGWNNAASLSDNSTISNGQISGSSEQNDSKTGNELRLQGLSERKVDSELSKYHGRDEQSGYGNERNDGLSLARSEILSKSESRDIRKEVKELLAAYIHR